MTENGEDRPSKGNGAGSEFGSTRWSLVLAAAGQSSPNSTEALATLCRIYWYPLYAYVRRRVGDIHEAQDLTQSFFVRLLDKEYLALADPARGRFRAFLLASMKNFLVNEWNKAKAQKRSAAAPLVPLDFELGETRYRLEPADRLTPERLYEKQWALALLEHVLDRLHAEFAQAGKERQFEKLKDFIAIQATEITYAEVAPELGMSPGAVKVAVHRLRRRYRDLLREEIAQTVASPAEVDEEIQGLFASLGT